MSDSMADLDSSLVTNNASSVFYHEQGIPIEFPFTPYPAQKQMIAKMIQAFEHCQNAILESPTGSGKSLAILVASLAWIRHKSENIVEAPNNDDSEAAENPFSNEADLSWMGRDADKFKLLISQGKFESAFTLYNTRKLERPKAPVKSSERKSGTKWNPTSQQDIPKIYIASRTHRQIAQLINELKNKTAYSPKMSVLGSRKQYCINDQVNYLDNIDEACKTKVEHKSCSAHKEVAALEGHPDIKPGGAKEIWDIEDLVKIGTDIDACPYFASRDIAQNAELVFCPYNYLIDPMIRKSMGIDVKNCILIIDEAHNIENTARDTGTFETSISVIGLVQAEIKEVLKYRHLVEANTVLASFLSIIRNWMERSEFRFGDGEKDGKLAQCFTGETMMREFEKMTLTKQSFSEIYNPAFQKVLAHFEDQNTREKNSEAVEVEERNPDGTITVKLQVKSRKTISGRSIRVLEKLFMVLEFIFNFTKSRVNDYTLAVLKKKQTAGRQNNDYDFCLWCMNSGVIFTELAEAAHSVILTSGTLSPMETFESELEVSFPIQLIADHVIDKSHVWANVISSGPSNYTMTGTYQNAKQPKYLEEVSLSICNAVLNIPYGVLCFFPSYAALNSLHYYINHTNKTIKNMITSKKKIFIEPQNRPTSEFNELLEEYYDCIKSAVNNPTDEGINGALFFAVYRGKVSEGIDFNDNNCRGVICIGIPFPSYGDKLVQLKRQYNDKKKQSAPSAFQKSKILSGSDWYDIQGYRALNQALGRCIRHKNDWGAIILLENRFCEYRHSKRLSKWVIPLLQKRVGNFRVAMEDLLQFVNRRRNIFPGKGYRLGGNDESDKSVDSLSVRPDKDTSNLDEAYQKLISAFKTASNQQAESSTALPTPSNTLDDASDDEMFDAMEDIDDIDIENDKEDDEEPKLSLLSKLCNAVLTGDVPTDKNGEEETDVKPTRETYSVVKNSTDQPKSTTNADTDSSKTQSGLMNETNNNANKSVIQPQSNQPQSTQAEKSKTANTTSEGAKNTAASTNGNTNSSTPTATTQPPWSPIVYDLTDSPEFTPAQLPPQPPYGGYMNGPSPPQPFYGNNPMNGPPPQPPYNNYMNGPPPQPPFNGMNGPPPPPQPPYYNGMNGPRPPYNGPPPQMQYNNGPPQPPFNGPMPPQNMNGQMAPLLGGNYGPPPGYTGPWHILYKPVLTPDGKSIQQPFIVYGPPPPNQNNGQTQPYLQPTPSPGQTPPGYANPPNKAPVQNDPKGKKPVAIAPNPPSFIHFTQPIVNHLAPRPPVAIAPTSKDKGKEVVRSKGKAPVRANNVNIPLPAPATSQAPLVNAPLNNKAPVQRAPAPQASVNKAPVQQTTANKVPVSNDTQSEADLPPLKPIKSETPEHYRMASSTSTGYKSKQFVVYHIKRKYLNFDANGVPSLKKIVRRKTLKPMSKPHVEVATGSAPPVQQSAPAPSPMPAQQQRQNPIATPFPQQVQQPAPKPVQQPVQQPVRPLVEKPSDMSKEVWENRISAALQNMLISLKADLEKASPSTVRPTPAQGSVNTPRTQATTSTKVTPGKPLSTAAPRAPPPRQAPTQPRTQQQNTMSERAYKQSERQEAMDELGFLLGGNTGSRPNPYRTQATSRSTATTSTPARPTAATSAPAQTATTSRATSAHNDLARKTVISLMETASKKLIAALQNQVNARKGSNKTQKTKADREVRKCTSEFNTIKTSCNVLSPDTASKFSKQVAEAEAKADLQIRKDAEETANALTQARASLEAQIWANADAHEKALLAQSEAVRNKANKTRLKQLANTVDTYSRMTTVLINQYTRNYGALPARKDTGKKAASKATTQPVASSSSAASSSTAASSSSSAAPNPSPLPKIKSELSIAGRNLSFSSSFSSVKSEPGTSSVGEGSSSTEVKPESGSKRSSDNVVEFIETASGLILPKRRKK